MLIRCLHITGVRNVLLARMNSLGRVNIIYGANGAGKTSVLESINLLSTGKSFRGHKISPLINSDSESCVVFGEVKINGAGYQPIGVERFKAGKNLSQIKISGKPVYSASELADKVPVQVISSDTFQLLEGSPSVRRQFLDWGVFHVEHRFHQVWKSMHRCLKQRNALLRESRVDRVQLELWTNEFVKSGQALDEFRFAYIQHLIPVFKETLARLTDLAGMQINYHRGWDREKSLSQVMLDSLERDIQIGHSTQGPQRADLRFRYQQMNANEVLSRGQIKLVVCALRVAQGFLLSKLAGRSCAFLVDDLPAELDINHRKMLCDLLETLDCQIFVTCVDKGDMVGCWSDSAATKMFHVEHGTIIENGITKEF